VAGFYFCRGGGLKQSEVFLTLSLAKSKDLCYNIRKEKGGTDEEASLY
jgi:hypothetical protein